jgi:hypothetical protein
VLVECAEASGISDGVFSSGSCELRARGVAPREVD